jgi:hypothetical protein
MLAAQHLGDAAQCGQWKDDFRRLSSTKPASTGSAGWLSGTQLSTYMRIALPEKSSGLHLQLGVIGIVSATVLLSHP